MTDGTEDQLDLGILDDLKSREDEGQVETEGAPVAEEPSDTPIETAPAEDNSDLEQVPEPLREMWRDMPEQQQQAIQRALELHGASVSNGLQPKLQERADFKRRLEALEPKAQQLDAILGDEDLVRRLYGLEGGQQAQPEDDTPLAEMDLTDEQTFAKKVLRLGGLDPDRFKQEIIEGVQDALGKTPERKKDGLKDAARQFWGGLKDQGVTVTPDVERIALEKLNAQAGGKILDIPPDELAGRLLPWVEYAIAVQAGSNGISAQKTAPGPGVTPTGTGARARTRAAVKPWERQKDDPSYKPPTLDAIYDSGGVSGDKLDALKNEPE